MRLEKVIKHYADSVCAELNIPAYMVTITQPNKPVVIIDEIESIRDFIESNAVLCSALETEVTAEKVILHYSEEDIQAEIVLRGSLCDAVFKYNGKQFFSGTMGYFTLDKFNFSIELLLKYFKENIDLYLERLIVEPTE